MGSTDWTSMMGLNTRLPPASVIQYQLLRLAKSEIRLALHTKHQKRGLKIVLQNHHVDDASERTVDARAQTHVFLWSSCPWEPGCHWLETENTGKCTFTLSYRSKNLQNSPLHSQYYSHISHKAGKARKNIKLGVSHGIVHSSSTFECLGDSYNVGVSSLIVF